MGILQNLRTMRKKAGLTQSDMAKICGVDRSTYTRCESGSRVMAREMLLTLADYFNVSIDDILDREVKESSKEQEMIEIVKRATPEQLKQIKNFAEFLFSQTDNR